MNRVPRFPENYLLSEYDVNDIENFDSFMKNLTDVSNSEPMYPITLNNVGVTNLRAMVFIRDFDSNKEYIPVLCEITAGMELSKNNRGIHMSRLIQNSIDISRDKWDSLDDFALALAKEVKQKQESKAVTVDVSGIYLQKRNTKQTKLQTLDTIHLLSKVTIDSEGSHTTTGMKVYNITACPCTRTYTKYSIVPELKKMGLSTDQINQIVGLTIAGTHMQRGLTTLIVDRGNSNISHNDIFYVLEESLHLVNELLKRPDEHELVTRALRNPQFAEDAVRQVAANTYNRFKDVLSPTADIYIATHLLDSIHIHDVRVVIRKTIGEIGEDLH